MGQHKNSFASRLRDARSEAGYTQEELAEKLGLDRKTISAWENLATKKREPSFSSMLELCKILNCDAGYLFGEHDCKTREATDVQEVTGLTEFSIARLRDLREYQNHLDFSLVDFIEHLLRTVDTRIPMSINALLKLPEYKTRIKDSEREEQLFAEIYADIKSMIKDIRKDIKRQGVE